MKPPSSSPSKGLPVLPTPSTFLSSIVCTPEDSHGQDLLSSLLDFKDPRNQKGHEIPLAPHPKKNGEKSPFYEIYLLFKNSFFPSNTPLF